MKTHKYNNYSVIKKLIYIFGLSLVVMQNAYARPEVTRLECQSSSENAKEKIKVSGEKISSEHFSTFKVIGEGWEISSPANVNNSVYFIDQKHDKVITLGYHTRSNGEAIDIDLWALPSSIPDLNLSGDKQFGFQFQARADISLAESREHSAINIYNSLLDCQYEYFPSN